MSSFSLPFFLYPSFLHWLSCKQFPLTIARTESVYRNYPRDYTLALGNFYPRLWSTHITYVQICLFPSQSHQLPNLSWYWELWAPFHIKLTFKIWNCYTHPKKSYHNFHFACNIFIMMVFCWYSNLKTQSGQKSGLHIFSITVSILLINLGIL